MALSCRLLSLFLRRGGGRLPFLYPRPLHLYSWKSNVAAEEARVCVAALMGTDPREIFFTSRVTECNNIAVKGVMHFYRDHCRHIITTQTKHKCVLDMCMYRQQEGFDVTYLHICHDNLFDTIRPDIGLVSVMVANNKIRVVQPLKEIGRICRKKGMPFHTDVAQVLGKIPIDVDEMGIGHMSLSDSGLIEY